MVTCDGIDVYSTWWNVSVKLKNVILFWDEFVKYQKILPGRGLPCQTNWWSVYNYRKLMEDLQFSERYLAVTWYWYWSRSTVYDDTCRITGFMRMEISHDRLPVAKNMQLWNRNRGLSEIGYERNRLIILEIHWTIINNPYSGLCAQI